MSVRLGFVCIAQDDYEPALSLATTAQELAKLAKKTALESEANFLSDEIARCSPAFDRIKNWAIRLSKSPDSTHANAACGRYLCFVKNAWSKGLPMLQKTKEAKWVDVATHELARPTLPFDQINLGNRWRDLASSGSVQQRHDLLLRAN